MFIFELDWKWATSQTVPCLIPENRSLITKLYQSCWTSTILVKLISFNAIPLYNTITTSHHLQIPEQLFIHIIRNQYAKPMHISVYIKHTKSNIERVESLTVTCCWQKPGVITIDRHMRCFVKLWLFTELLFGRAGSLVRLLTAWQSSIVNETDRITDQRAWCLFC